MAVKNKKSYVIVIRDNRYIRKEANTFSEKIIEVKKNDKYEYLEEIKNDWYKVKVKRKIGWIHSSTVKIIK